MAQRIVDLDVVVPETLGVRIDGVVYDLPGDIPIPTFVEIERLTVALEDPAAEENIEDLYRAVLELFSELNELPPGPDGEPSLPIGPRRLGALVVQLYAGEIEEPDEPERPTRPRAGTRSTSQRKPKRSRSSK